MHTEVTVNTGAVKTEVDSEGNRGPGGVLGTAVEAGLCRSARVICTRRLRNLKIRGPPACGVAANDERDVENAYAEHSHSTVEHNARYCSQSCRLITRPASPRTPFHRFRPNRWSARTLLAFWFLRWAKTAVVWALVGSMIESGSSGSGRSKVCRKRQKTKTETE